MCFLDSKTGERLLNLRERDAARRAAQTRAEREHAARLAAETELAALRALLDEKR